MANALNTSFTADPAVFIADRDHAVGGHDDLKQALSGSRETTLVSGSAVERNARRFLQVMDAMGVISFEFVPYHHTRGDMLVMRPLVDPAVFSAGDLGASFGPVPSNPVRGYWFPYKVPTPQQMTAAKKTGGGGPPSVMGWVDFEKTNPQYPFVFTGSMQGCHIVVAQSPDNPHTHFRAYHYASPANYRGQAGDMAYILWPASVGGGVCAWLSDSQYAAAPEDDAVDAFNFLHYRAGSWRIYTQMQKRETLLTKGSGVILFDVMGSRVSDPIPTTPLANNVLISAYTTWKTAG